MTSLAKVGVVVVGLLLTVCGGWYLSRPVNEEDRIREQIEAVAAGARDADIDAVMAPISEQYRDLELGGHQRADLERLLYLQFLRRGPISVALSPIEVTRAGDVAVARMDAAVADFEDGVVPVDADLWAVEVELRREDGDWRIVAYRRLDRGP